MSCDYCWPGNCSGACDPKRLIRAHERQAKSDRLWAERKLAEATMHEHEAARLRATENTD